MGDITALQEAPQRSQWEPAPFDPVQYEARAAEISNLVSRARFEMRDWLPPLRVPDPSSASVPIDPLFEEGPPT